MDWELLRGLADHERHALLQATVRGDYRRGEAVCREGEAGNTLHLLVSGRVAVRVSTPMGDIATLVVLGPGDVFGELALIGRETVRTATVVALEATQTLALHRSEFEILMATHARTQTVLVELLAQQVQRLSAAVLEALYLPVDKRLARRLHDLVGIYRDGSTNGSTEIPIKQEDLATMAGTSRQTANGVLQALAADGIVALGRRGTRVLDVERLAERAR